MAATRRMAQCAPLDGPATGERMTHVTTRSRRIVMAAPSRRCSAPQRCSPCRPCRHRRRTASADRAISACSSTPARPTACTTSAARTRTSTTTASRALTATRPSATTRALCVEQRSPGREERRPRLYDDGPTGRVGLHQARRNGPAAHQLVGHDRVLPLGDAQHLHRRRGNRPEVARSWRGRQPPAEQWTRRTSHRAHVMVQQCSTAHGMPSLLACLTPMSGGAPRMLRPNRLASFKGTVDAGDPETAGL